MLEVFLDLNYENKVKANENLYNFVDIFVADLDYCIQYDFIFPEFLYRYNPEKCRKVLDDLHLWINDSFTHHLPPLHQYVLYSMIKTWINWVNDEPELLGFQKADSEESDTEEIHTNDNEWVENHPNDLDLFITLFLSDLDFLEIGRLYEGFKNSSKNFQMTYYLYLEQYKDLMPKDIINEFEHIKNSIYNDDFFKDKSNPSNVKSEDDFLNAINNIIEQFSRQVIEEGSYKLLWNDDHSPKKEEASQLLFNAFAKPLLKEYNIVISREVDTGRGLVDFKLSLGISLGY